MWTTPRKKDDNHSGRNCPRKINVAKMYIWFHKIVQNPLTKPKHKWGICKGSFKLLWDGDRIFSSGRNFGSKWKWVITTFSQKMRKKPNVWVIFTKPGQDYIHNPRSVDLWPPEEAAILKWPLVPVANLSYSWRFQSIDS